MLKFDPLELPAQAKLPSVVDISDSLLFYYRLSLNLDMRARHPSVNRIIFVRLIAHHRLSSTLSSSFRKPTFYLVTSFGHPAHL